MAIDFETLRGEILSTARSAGDKFNDASAQAKKRLAIRSKEDFIKAKYAELGQAYFEAHKEDDLAEFPEIFQAIHNAQIEIDSLNDQLQGTQSVITCPQCGAKQSRDNFFCSNCGSALH